VIAIFWNQMHTSFNVQLSRYYRNLYGIIRLVDESEIADKSLYVRILRAQLSDWELLLIFYNCVASPRATKLARLSEKYRLFDNLPQQFLLDPLHMGLLSSSAFA